MTTTQTAARPPPQTAHGINSSTFNTLWAGDVDTETVSEASTETGMRELAAVADIPVGSPPIAVAQWNHGDHQEFPETTAQTSIHPADVDLVDGQYIRDAYTTIFAVQPSTKLQQSPTDQPLYIAAAGTVLGTVDYRVQVPADEDTVDRDTSWRLLDHEITETRLTVNDVVVARAEGTHTPSLSFQGLDAATTDSHVLALEATITTDLEKQVVVTEWTCESTPTTNESTTTNTTTTTTSDCWETTAVTTTYPTEQVTVREAWPVHVHDPAVQGYRAAYPTGEQAIVLSQSEPIRSYSSTKGAIQSTWRFFSARDDRWDQLLVENTTGETTQRSPLVPLQVHAFPSAIGPQTSPNVALLDRTGRRSDPPRLPQHVHMDVPTEPYVIADRFIARYTSTPATITVHGVVRGVETTLRPAEFRTVPIHRSNLSITVVNTSRGTVTVDVSLRDAETAHPISTVDRAGVVVVAGERVNTNRSGTVRVTLPRPMSTLKAQYEPGDWWQADSDRQYLGSTAVIAVESGPLRVLSTTFALGIWILLFLLAVFLIDRITGWHSWPPWRGL